ncbi:sigma-70 family RNA polymerase sigma factor [Nocardia colli]|uniref:Sigma-70 family RNA polymerase sigma factor n=1 Tax=Nocardia colli TaxID=2545717 RepID=A0A5N0ENA9_9NOCA|nr:sigma-70 family RNA polymerase sigma factor [Nocardia colli]
MTVYQQRAAELARLRRAAIDEAHQTLGLNYTDIAAQLGITKGRVTQIRTSAPPQERAFFGVGPVSVGIPRRYGMEEGRNRPFFDAVDMTSQATVEDVLGRLAIAAVPLAIEPTTDAVPEGDAVLICGPKSAPVARVLLASDPYLDFEQVGGGQWWIRGKAPGTREWFDSPYRRVDQERSDVGYFARHVSPRGVTVHIAGITSVGSLGVIHWLAKNLRMLFLDNEDSSMCGVVRCDFDEKFAVESSSLLAGPYTW